jgi:uncharacterized protein
VTRAAGAIRVSLRHKQHRHRPVLLIMAKLARMGQVKTRLARQIGSVAATAFYRHNLAAVTRRLARDPRWTTVLAVSPDSSLARPGWPTVGSAQMAQTRQGRGNLGVRMQRLLERRQWAEPWKGGIRGFSLTGPAVIIGTDIPTIRPQHIAAAFKALSGKRCVFGPATDGGFWLVGQRRVPAMLTLFDGVRWSSAETLADCLRRTSPDDVAIVATLGDVDDKAELDAISNWFGRLVLPHSA